MKLCQVNALVKGKKSEAEKAVNEAYKVVQKEGLFDGRQRVYRPLDEEHGERLPGETQKVQQSCKGVLSQAREKWSEVWDLVLTQESGNQHARADVKVGDEVVLPQVPVGGLLFLEKQLNDLETFLSKLPTPDPAYDWSHDPNTDLLKTPEMETVRTKKVEKFQTVVQPTKEHPAQVAKVTEDEQVGRWVQTLFTGRIPAGEKNAYLSRVRQLRDAVKLAREEANSIKVEKLKAAEGIFNFVFRRP